MTDCWALPFNSLHVKPTFGTGMFSAPACLSKGSFEAIL